VNSVRNGIEVLKAFARGDAPRMIERLASELFLTLKVPINPALLQPSGAHEIGKRGSRVTALIEQPRRLLDDVLLGFFPFSHQRLLLFGAPYSLFLERIRDQRFEFLIQAFGDFIYLL